MNPTREKQFGKFIRRLRAKMRVGAKEHGKVPGVSRLFGELEGELLDIVGWGFLLWEKLQKLEAKVAKLKLK